MRLVQGPHFENHCFNSSVTERRNDKGRNVYETKMKILMLYLIHELTSQKRDFKGLPPGPVTERPLLPLSMRASTDS